MRQIFFGFIMLFSSVCVYGQDSKKVIQYEFNAYVQSMMDKDYQKMTDYIAEDLFTFLPKEKFVDLMAKSFNSPEFNIIVKDPKIISIGDIKSINAKYYSIVHYSNYLNFKYNETEDGSAPDTIVIKKAFEDGFGAPNVKYDNKTGVYKIFNRSKLCAISPDGKSGWKFIGLENDLKPLLQKILPKEIMDAM